MKYQFAFWYLSALVIKGYSGQILGVPTGGARGIFSRYINPIQMRIGGRFSPSITVNMNPFKNKQIFLFPVFF